MPIYFLTCLPIKILCIAKINIRFNNGLFCCFFFSYGLLYSESRIAIDLVFCIKYQATSSWKHVFQDTSRLNIIYFHCDTLLKINLLRPRKVVLLNKINHGNPYFSQYLHNKTETVKLQNIIFYSSQKLLVLRYLIIYTSCLFFVFFWGFLWGFFWFLEVFLPCFCLFVWVLFGSCGAFPFLF